MIVKQQPNLLLLPKPEIIKDATFRYNFMGLVTRFFQRWVATAFTGIKIQCIKKLWWMIIPKFPDSVYRRNFTTGFSHLKSFKKNPNPNLDFDWKIPNYGRFLLFCTYPIALHDTWASANEKSNPFTVPHCACFSLYTSSRPLPYVWSGPWISRSCPELLI